MASASWVACSTWSAAEREPMDVAFAQPAKGCLQSAGQRSSVLAFLQRSNRCGPAGQESMLTDCVGPKAD